MRSWPLFSYLEVQSILSLQRLITIQLEYSLNVWSNGGNSSGGQQLLRQNSFRWKQEKKVKPALFSNLPEILLLETCHTWNTCGKHPSRENYSLRSGQYSSVFIPSGCKYQLLTAEFQPPQFWYVHPSQMLFLLLVQPYQPIVGQIETKLDFLLLLSFHCFPVIFLEKIIKCLFCKFEICLFLPYSWFFILIKDDNTSLYMW